MDHSDWNTMMAIVDQALELPEKQRLQFIESKCGKNTELKDEVLQFLKSISESGDWLENLETLKDDFMDEITDDINQKAQLPSLAGQQVGAYILKEKIGEGGMGTVYLADHSNRELKHQAAIKIIDIGRTHDDHLRRFKREQKILAGLNHPGIARFYDSGFTENGLPYIVMEYIEGVPLNEYCQKNQSTIEQKIDLFKQVLEAIRYAHENLVIHRDLKPGNIFVNHSGTVKVLDFGISKLLEDDSEDITQTGARMLTVRYAAPEQIRQEKITTATDLYSLGMFFYELITNIMPFDTEDLTSYQIEHIVLNEEPPKPSMRAASDSLKRELKGDLDAITLKAIRKEPDKRYRVANEFIADLDNYLNGHPVTAHADSFRYRSKKFYKRHQAGILAGFAVLLMLISLAGFHTWRVAQERDFAQFEADRAEEVTSFLVSMLELNNPEESSGNDITINDALNRGIELLDQEELSVLSRATILGTIGSIQKNNGEIDPAGINLQTAIALITDSLSRQTKKTLDIGTAYAEWLHTVGNLEDSDRTYQLTDSLFSVRNFTNSLNYVGHQLSYSDFLMETGKDDEALHILEGLDQRLINYFDSANNPKAMDFLANVYNNRGRVYMNMAQNQQAIDNLEQALYLKLQIFDENNPNIARIYHNKGVVYTTMGNYPMALETAKKAYDIRLQVYNPTHQLIGSTLHLLGTISMALGHIDEALEYMNQSVEINRIQHGENHVRYALALREYASLLSSKDQQTLANHHIAEAESIIRENYGTDTPYYGFMMSTYAEIQYNGGDYAQALHYGESAIENFSANFASDHPNIGQIYVNNGKYALNNREFVRADSLLQTAMHILESHYDTANPIIQTADSLYQENKNHLEAVLSNGG